MRRERGRENKKFGRSSYFCKSLNVNDFEGVFSNILVNGIFRRSPGLISLDGLFESSLRFKVRLDLSEEETQLVRDEER